MPEVSSRIEKASIAFGSLRVAICNNSNMLIATKRAVYKAVVLAMLLHEYVASACRKNRCAASVLSNGENYICKCERTLNDQVISCKFANHPGRQSKDTVIVVILTMGSFKFQGMYAMACHVVRWCPVLLLRHSTMCMFLSTRN